MCYRSLLVRGEPKRRKKEGGRKGAMQEETQNKAMGEDQEGALHLFRRTFLNKGRGEKREKDW